MMHEKSKSPKNTYQMILLMGASKPHAELDNMWRGLYVYMETGKERSDRLNCETENDSVLRRRGTETHKQLGHVLFLNLSGRFDGILLLNLNVCTLCIFCNFKTIKWMPLSPGSVWGSHFPVLGDGQPCCAHLVEGWECEWFCLWSDFLLSIHVTATLTRKVSGVACQQDAWGSALLFSAPLACWQATAIIHLYS